MTFDRLNELNAMKDTIRQMTDDVDNLDEFVNYHTIQIIGRINGERLDQAEVLLTIDAFTAGYEPKTGFHAVQCDKSKDGLVLSMEIRSIALNETCLGGKLDDIWEE